MKLALVRRGPKGARPKYVYHNAGLVLLREGEWMRARLRVRNLFSRLHPHHVRRRRWEVYAALELGIEGVRRLTFPAVIRRISCWRRQLSGSATLLMLYGEKTKLRIIDSRGEGFASWNRSAATSSGAL